ncbi:ParB N-terminal domain-containing protein [Burkholderia pyrrocinia]|uniref:ParB N-terminal domain-containing protein n=1 Tax=Burkholderia pyrrocinia TaxID=60550 RepID=UPI00104F22E7|nr:ParB N-terminal domain-containing protein [Burkholderia pyrrocinia]TDA48922.1 hypothetical protein EVG18_02770 [Burkholderia pyrrocinia]
MNISNNVGAGQGRLNKDDPHKQDSMNLDKQDASHKNSGAANHETVSQKHLNKHEAKPYTHGVLKQRKESKSVGEINSLSKRAIDGRTSSQETIDSGSGSTENPKASDLPSTSNGAPLQAAGASAPNQAKSQGTLQPNGPDVGPSPTFTIFGTDTAQPPDATLSQSERMRRTEVFSDRVQNLLMNVESGSEGERNVKSINARPFTTPMGYFQSGLMAAGYDPHEKITVTYETRAKLGANPGATMEKSTRTYEAWEIAAGALKHDEPESGGVVTETVRSFANPGDEHKATEFEATGSKLQDRWASDIAKPTTPTSNRYGSDEAVAKSRALHSAYDQRMFRSGQADAFSTRATLESVKNDPSAFGQLSPEGQAAVKRTLDPNTPNKDRQVIIPNVYGYPLQGYAFVPYQPYDGNYENRPNQGLLIDLNRGTITEIHGDKDFADYAKRHRNELIQGMNARDSQGGLDEHWPSAAEVLNKLIAGTKVTYRGYNSFLSDKNIPIEETFNYTRSRDSDYQLKYGSLATGPDQSGGSIASQYEQVNKKNAEWLDQTEVFGVGQQKWKTVKEIWGRTVGYIPIVGDAGKIVFGIHDAIYGMTADDRRQGAANATISFLQLGHDMARQTTSGGGLAGTFIGRWVKNQKTSEFEFVTSPKNPPVAPHLGAAQGGLIDNKMISKYAVKDVEPPQVMPENGVFTKVGEKGVRQSYIQGNDGNVYHVKNMRLEKLNGEEYTAVDVVDPKYPNDPPIVTFYRGNGDSIWKIWNNSSEITSKKIGGPGEAELHENHPILISREEWNKREKYEMDRGFVEKVNNAYKDFDKVYIAKGDEGESVYLIHDEDDNIYINIKDNSTWSAPTANDPSFYSYKENLRWEIDEYSRGRVKGEGYEYVDINNVKFGRDNISLDDLRTAAVKRRIENGQALGPIAAHQNSDGTFTVENGNHRLQAALDLKLTTIPIKLEYTK